jgi:hypothetical protein
MIVVIIFLQLSLNVTGLVVNNYDESQWIIDYIDVTSDGSLFVDSAIDSNNILYVSYYDRDEEALKVAYLQDNDWIIKIVDSQANVGEYSSIVIDANNIAHISYYDSENKDLKYAKKINYEWFVQTVDQSGDVGKFSSIDIDSQNNPHISYYDESNGDLKYCYYNGYEWIFEVVQKNQDIGLGCSLSLDNNDASHISFTDDSDKGLYYAKRENSIWTSSLIDSDCNVFASTSIAVDSNGLVHIAYFDVPTSEENWNLKYAFFNENEWRIEIVDPDLKYFWNDWGVSISVDKYERVHISYYYWYKWDLKYACKINDKWSIEYVDTEGDVGVYASLSLDLDNYPIIVYMSRSNLILKYAKKFQFDPDPPLKPNGPDSGKPAQIYSYTFTGYDFDNDKIQYVIDWGDTSSYEYTEFVNSGESIKIDYVWSDQGSYSVRYKVIDSNGYESIWSDSLDISISKNRQFKPNFIYPFFLKIKILFELNLPRIVMNQFF